MMKIYHSLPDEVKRNGKTYKYFGACSGFHEKPKGKLITISVLSKNLRGRTDLHGREYQPSRWYYILEP